MPRIHLFLSGRCHSLPGAAGYGYVVHAGEVRIGYGWWAREERDGAPDPTGAALWGLDHSIRRAWRLTLRMKPWR